MFIYCHEYQDTTCRPTQALIALGLRNLVCGTWLHKESKAYCGEKRKERKNDLDMLYTLMAQLVWRYFKEKASVPEFYGRRVEKETRRGAQDTHGLLNILLQLRLLLRPSKHYNIERLK